MRQAEIFSTLIGDIYDAALEPALWPSTLRRAAGFVGGSSASLYAKNLAGGSCQIYFDDGALDEGWVRRYTSQFVKVDPSTVRQFFGEIGQALSTADLMPYREFLDTRFAAEWARPQQLVDALSAVLEKGGAEVMLFTVFRDVADGLVDAAVRRRMNLVAPHIRRATLVATTMATASTEATSLADTLDAVAAGVFLLDRRGAVVHANSAARSMLASELLFRRGMQRLTLLDDQADRALVTALAGHAAETGATALAIPGSDGTKHVAHLLPLGTRTLATDLPRRATLALFVKPASFSGVSAPEALAKAYRLTPTELRILLAIIEIGGVPEVAETLGVAESTVRFHLRRLFEKTGVRRQAELVRLAAGFSAPLLG